MIYYYIVIWGSEIIQIVAWNYDGFLHLSFIFSQKKLFHYFKDYLMTELTIR
jgi:hypothetical protein